MKEVLEYWRPLFEALMQIAYFIMIVYLCARAVLEDKKVYMIEVAQIVLVGILCYITYMEVHREHEWPYFSETVYLFLVIGIASLAGIKGIETFYTKGMTIKENRDRRNEEQQQE